MRLKRYGTLQEFLDHWDTVKAMQAQRNQAKVPELPTCSICGQSPCEAPEACAATARMEASE